MTPKKLAIVTILSVVVLAVVGLAGVGVYINKYSPYAPYLQGTRNAAFVQRLETMIRNRSEFVPPASGEVSDEQLKRFVTVEEHVEAFIGTRSRAFRDACERLQRAASERGSLTVQVGSKEVGAIGSVFFQAKQAQVDALNAASFSKDEFEWVRRELYTSAEIDLPQLDLAGLTKFDTLQDRIDIKQRRRAAPASAATRRQVERLVPSLERWRALAFFGL